MTDVNLITAKQVNFKIYKGDSKRIVLTFKDDAGAAIDLSAKTFAFQVRAVAGGKILKDFTSGTGITLSGAGNNTITTDALDDLEKGNYVYDLQATDNSEVVTYLFGTISVQTDISR